MQVTVEDCERVQTAWLVDQARTLGGESWEDDGLVWAHGPEAAYLLFPRQIDPKALARGLRAVRPSNVIVGAWLATDVDATALGDAGFERGWSPWWMTLPLAALDARRDERIEVGVRAERTWYAAAYAEPGHRFAGHAWSHLVGDLAGVFDMSVWQPFRRQRLGTGLLHAVCAAAAEAGATDAVLNATPDGKKLYATCGFTQIGEGITWWLHPAT